MRICIVTALPGTVCTASGLKVSPGQVSELPGGGGGLVDWKNLVLLSGILISSDLGKAWNLHILKRFLPGDNH